LTHTVSLLADHKGFTKPRVVGDEYMVDAIVNIGAYVQGGITLTAASVGLSQITQLMVTGVEEIGQSARAVVSNTGAYESISSAKIILSTGSAQLAGTSDEGIVRIRVYGLL